MAAENHVTITKVLVFKSKLCRNFAMVNFFVFCFVWLSDCLFCLVVLLFVCCFLQHYGTVVLQYLRSVITGEVEVPPGNSVRHDSHTAKTKKCIS